MTYPNVRIRRDVLDNIVRAVVEVAPGRLLRFGDGFTMEAEDVAEGEIIPEECVASIPESLLRAVVDAANEEGILPRDVPAEVARLRAENEGLRALLEEVRGRAEDDRSARLWLVGQSIGGAS